MRIVNQSRLPDAEVAELVHFAFRGVADAGVVVEVKNTRHGYSGTTYGGVPDHSSIRPTDRQFVVLRIGPDATFPVSNIHETSRLIRKVDLPEVQPSEGSAGIFSQARSLGLLAELPDDPGYSYGFGFPRGGGAIIKVYRVERHPYGGKGSPEIVVNDWREALVAVAAHEARHVWQGQRKRAGKRQQMSEVDAEKHAAKRLTEYRDALAARRAAPREMAGV